LLTEKATVDPMTELFDTIRSPVTKRKYELRMRQFFAWVYGDQQLTTPHRKGRSLSDSKDEEDSKDRLARAYSRKFVAKARADTDWANGTVEAFLREQKERAENHEISASTISMYTKPLKLFCVMNDIPINWLKLSKKMPKGRHAANDRPPTAEEVKRILQFADPRIKPVVLTMLSSGIRIGSWDHLRWGHIQPVVVDGKLMAARVKAFNTKSKRWYTTYMTPEAYHATKEYVDGRQRKGEEITKDSPVVRNLLDTDRGGSGKPNSPILMSSRVVMHLIERAISSAQIRPKRLPPGQTRYEFKATHGFRKYFDTVCERHMKTLHVEMLEDHDTGLKESYNRPSEADILNDYLKAVQELTITDEWRAAFESEERVREQKESNDDLVSALTTQNNQLQEQVKVLADRLGKAESVQTEVQARQQKTDELMDKLFEDPKFEEAVRRALRGHLKAGKLTA